MLEMVKSVLETKIRPELMKHYGDIELVDVNDGVVTVKLLGSCSHCPSAVFTMEDLVESTLKDSIPEVKEVVLDNSVSDELIEEVLNIIRKNR
ncbi:Fe-S cluster biogenesis protein NfuA [Serpentinicella alkaliphila]|uniref:Fe-S cluster biogenesis protein NfuA n=2 Tax=Serpentinicella alkaliphila TaxID=1734049 RepID=A0A4V6NSD2_9FIRM|nr:Fe-S cluster biogenesis protein NfuA [Serpentinicella alkaliphila]